MTEKYAGGERMKKNKPILTKPSGATITEHEVKTLWVYAHAEKLHVKLYPERRATP